MFELSHCSRLLGRCEVSSEKGGCGIQLESLIFCCSSFLSENIICDLTVKTKNENTYTFRAVVINRGERKAVVCRFLSVVRWIFPLCL